MMWFCNTHLSNRTWAPWKQVEEMAAMETGPGKMAAMLGRKSECTYTAAVQASLKSFPKLWSKAGLRWIRKKPRNPSRVHECEVARKVSVPKISELGADNLCRRPPILISLLWFSLLVQALHINGRYTNVSDLHLELHLSDRLNKTFDLPFHFYYCSALGTNFSSLFIFWISDKLTAGPGSFLAPGRVFFFSSSVVAGRDYNKKCQLKIIQWGMIQF